MGPATDVTRLRCRLEDGSEADAVAFAAITGPVQIGDKVLLNTTASDLRLGSGGCHFVIAVSGSQQTPVNGPGHIMKLRYTPAQIAVEAIEEPSSAHHSAMAEADSLQAMPVVCCELVSQAPAVIAGLGSGATRPRIAIVVTDEAALGIPQCELLAKLRRGGWTDTVITTGHAFGGDFEAVNGYSGLLAARHVAEADVTIVTPGHGAVGTDTRWGFSGVAQGESINAVHSLGGEPIAVVRAGTGDSRARHCGISHHSRTAFSRVALAPFSAAWPEGSGSSHRAEWDTLILETRGRMRGFTVPGASLALDRFEADFGRWTTMGRTRAEDPLYFEAAAAAGILARRFLEGNAD